MGFEDWGTANKTSNFSNSESDQSTSEDELNQLRTEADRLAHRPKEIQKVHDIHKLSKIRSLASSYLAGMFT